MFRIQLVRIRNQDIWAIRVLPGQATADVLYFIIGGKEGKMKAKKIFAV